MKKIAVALSALALVALAAPGASAKPSKKGSFTFSIDTTVTCTAYDDAGASLGTMTIDGSGTFENKKKTASGGGNWERKDAAGISLATGTWTIAKLTSFKSFGGTNANWGGEAKFKASFVSGATTYPAMVWITNTSAGRVPGGKKEGCRVNLKDVVNFNKASVGTVSMTRTA